MELRATEGCFGVAEGSGLEPGTCGAHGEQLQDALAVHAVLCLRFARPLEDEERKTRVLLDGLEALRIEYFGDPEDSEDPQWLESWNGFDVLPELISVRLDLPRDDARHWPVLLVAPKVRSGGGLP